MKVSLDSAKQMANTSFMLWTSTELKKLIELNSEDVQLMCSYIASITKKDELVSFVKELFVGDVTRADYELDGQKREFLRELVLRWEKVRVPANVIAYKKEKDCMTSKPDKNELVKPKSKQENNPFDMNDLKKSLSSSAKKGKKPTYVSLYGKDGEMHTRSVILPGRNMCECQAQKHK